MKPRFQDRTVAGQQLAEQLSTYAHRSDVLVLALPRGGVPVAFEIAKALGVPMDLCLVRKVGMPDHHELAMGAIASGGVRVFNHDVLRSFNISAQTFDREALIELTELQRRDRLYRGNRPQPDIRDRIIILVDDGLATGMTMKAAISALRSQKPRKIVIAVPVAPPELCNQLKKQVDQLICLMMPEPFHGISLWYENFAQLTDDQVLDLLSQHGSSPNPKKMV